MKTRGADGESIDCFFGEFPESEIVFVIDQEHPSGRFDEHKAMLAFRNAKEAKEGYLANYPPGWHCGPVTAMTLDQFRAWLQHGDTKARVADQVSRYTADQAPATEAEPIAPPTFEQEVEQVAERYNLTASERAEMLDRYCAALAPRPRDLEQDLQQIGRELDLTPAELDHIKTRYQQGLDDGT